MPQLTDSERNILKWAKLISIGEHTSGVMMHPFPGGNYYWIITEEKCKEMERNANIEERVVNIKHSIKNSIVEIREDIKKLDQIIKGLEIK